MKKLSIILLSLFLSGCAAAIYRGPSGATFEDFAKVRHMCYTSLQQETVASAYVGDYGGSYGESSRVSCGAFTSCLASYGYREDPNGNFSAEGIGISCN